MIPCCVCVPCATTLTFALLLMIVGYLGFRGRVSNKLKGFSKVPFSAARILIGTLLTYEAIKIRWLPFRD